MYRFGMSKPAHHGTAVFLASMLVAGCASSAHAPEPAASAAKAPVESSAAPAAVASSAAAARAFKTLGRADAPVTMMEFTDLQCPYCAEFELQTLPVLRARYVDTGLVKFASYDLPLNFHPYALQAAIAAHCAGEQGQYWPYREALYREQSTLPTAPYGQLAQRFGLDLARFESCRSDPERQALVLTDAQKAASKGIQ